MHTISNWHAVYTYISDLYCYNQHWYKWYIPTTSLIESANHVTDSTLRGDSLSESTVFRCPLAHFIPENLCCFTQTVQQVLRLVVCQSAWPVASSKSTKTDLENRKHLKEAWEQWLSG